MFGFKAPNFGAGGVEGVVRESVIDYNFFASGTAESNIPQHIENGTITAYDGFKPGVIDVVHGENDIYGKEPGDNDPKFVSFPFLTNPLFDINYKESWDFHLQESSPALDASKTRTGLIPFFSTSTNCITVNGKTYNSPLPANYFGAFEQN